MLDLASSLVECRLVLEEDRGSVAELINEELYTMDSLLFPENNNLFAYYRIWNVFCVIISISLALCF